MMQRQYSDGGREADAFGPRRHIGQHQIGAGKHAERAEMMLADPRRVEADLLSVNRLVEDVGDEAVRVAAVVIVVVVAQREIAELHPALLALSEWRSGATPILVRCRRSRPSP